ncbi:hypothetical protein [Natronobacterium gregoryi]|uniref:Uncharacterized protein n=1 Tax=Natronobacterium gregoryi (strain ATCC 43098 / DSM 3393 / CCM 3738 / CIP 104747 / IAM 13177 / JCM 8860 / NBRC 102187 / NCIMB 2189 / SP2) TaxID=797304 RepID=A0A2J4JHP7_NATGS|nr:hypothetical protein [Natronobacterium gregoryi]PLK21429.1 hypothetical protein CYV19_03790 [Natronobacterium gregoryi SP2]
MHRDVDRDPSHEATDETESRVDRTRGLDSSNHRCTDETQNDDLPSVLADLSSPVADAGVVEKPNDWTQYDHTDDGPGRYPGPDDRLEGDRVEREPQQRETASDDGRPRWRPIWIPRLEDQ